MTSLRRSGRRTVRALASSVLVVTLAACGSGGSSGEEAAPSEPEPSSESSAPDDPSESDTAEESSEQSGDAISVSGISFVPPEKWMKIEAEELQARGQGSKELAEAAEAMGMAPEQLVQVMGQADLFLFDPQSPNKDFADNINVLAPGGELPPTEEIRRQYEQLGATVSDVTTEDSDLGEVVVVAYSLPAGPTLEVTGRSLTMEGAEGLVTLTVSTTDDAKAAQVADDVLATLAEG